jgi:hypothetical protein
MNLRTDSYPSPVKPAAKPLLDLGADFDANFGQRSFGIRHHLAGHPLFDLPRLAGLAGALPKTAVEYNAGDIPISVEPHKTPHTGLSIEETVQRIEQCNSWMVLKNVERDPEYSRLLDDCLAEVQRRGHARVTAITMREAFVFISSPGAVTPYHMDPEWNFLLQVRGSKQMTVFPCDPDIVSEEELERFYSGGHHRNMQFRPEYDRKATVFSMQPGDGVHVPVTHPHWVKVGGDISVSFSITFQTRESERRCALYALHHQLRARGGQPRPVGQSPWRDSLRYNWHRACRRLGRLLRRNTPSPQEPLPGMRM